MRLSILASAMLSTIFRSVALVIGIALAQVVAVRAQEVSGDVLLQVEGVLQEGDTMLPDRSLYDEYIFEGQAGQAVLVNLESTAFDPYLILLNDTSETLAENDDWDGTRNSTIGYILPDSGTYKIFVNAYADTGAGAYNLVVRKTELDHPAIIIHGVLQTILGGLESAYLEGNLEVSINTFQQALSISQEQELPEIEGLILLSLGEIYNLSGSYSQALEYGQRALTISRENGNRNYEALALVQISQSYAWLGQSQKGFEYAQEALTIGSQDESDGVRFFAYIALGSHSNELGNHSKAIEYFQQALDIAADNNGNFERGSQVAGLDLSRRGQLLIGISDAYYSLKRYPEALEYQEQALRFLQEKGEPLSIAISIASTGDIYYNLGEHAQALDYYQKALIILQTIDAPIAKGYVLDSIGQSLEILGYPTLAIPYFKEAINIYEKVRSENTALTNELQQSFVKQFSHTYRSLADLLLQQDRVLEAQRVLDLLKVQELDEILQGVRSEGTTTSGIDLLPQESEFWASKDEILAQAIPAATELFDLRQIPFSERSSEQNSRIVFLENLQSQILAQFIDFVASEDVQKLTAQLSRTAQQQDILTELNQFPNLQDNLADIGNAVLLYPLILEDRLELVLVTPNGPPTRHPVPISREQLTQTISDFQQALRDKNSDPEALAQQLYQWLIFPLEPALAAAEANTIIYAPDGPLRYIPLAALHDGNQWLAQRYQVNHITAASLTDLNLRPSREPDILAGAYSEVSHSISAGGQTLTFAGLPYASIEVDRLQNAFPTTPFFGNDFSRSNTEVLFNDHSIIHLATHAALLIGSPLESFILFGDGGQLTLEELKSWRGRLRSVDLVVLSACETGTGSIKDANGEEILGFGYLMQDAGARAVISSLWPVSDGGTQELMTNFYEALQIDGMTKAEALQHAQIALITGSQIDASTGERFVQKPRNSDDSQALSNSRLSHPYYWAPFILIGNGL